MAARTSALSLREGERLLQDQRACLPFCRDTEGPCQGDHECEHTLTCNRGVCGWRPETSGYFRLQNDPRGNNRVYRADGSGTYWLAYKRDVENVPVFTRFSPISVELVDVPEGLQEVSKPYFQVVWQRTWFGAQPGETTPEGARMPLFGIRTQHFNGVYWLKVAISERASCLTGSQTYIAGIVGHRAAPLIKCRSSGDVITRLTCLTQGCTKIGVECAPLHSPNERHSHCEVDPTKRILARHYNGQVAEKNGQEFHAVCPDGYAMSLLRWNFKGRRASVVCKPYRYVQTESKNENKGGK